MKEKHKINKIWLLLAVIFALCIFLWYAKGELRYDRANYTEVASKNGVWDLTEIDFSNTVVRLIGDFEHIENEMLTPQEFEQKEHLAERGNPVDVNNSRTARFTLLMPKQDIYSFNIKGDYARLVYINGEYRGSIGVPSANKETFVPAYGEISVDAPSVDKTVELIVQGANFCHRGGSHYTHVLIGNNSELNWFVQLQSSVEMFMVGVLFALFIVHLMLSTTLKNKSLNLCFSALCFVYCIRVSLTGAKVFYDFFPSVPWEYTIKTEYHTVALSAFFLSYVISLQFKGCINKIGLNIFNIIVISFNVAFLLVDTYVASHLVRGLTAVYFVAIIFYASSLFFWFVKQIKNKQKINIEQKITVMSFTIFCFAAICDSFYYNGTPILYLRDSVTEIATLTFVLFEALAIFYTTIEEAKSARNAEREAVIHAKNLESVINMKTEFLQDMSHEMKTPLNVISTGADYAKRQLLENNVSIEQTKETIDVIRDETARLGRMIGGMVDMANLAAVDNRQKIDFANLLHDCIRSFEVIGKKTQNNLSSSIPQDLPFIFVDKESMITVLNNLLINSMQHTSCGVIEVAASFDNSYIMIEIRDNGSGIDSELLPNVTDRGVTGADGMGIGLYLCKTVVSAHGGEFLVQSEKDVGTTVTFTVPVYGGQEEGHSI